MNYTKIILDKLILALTIKLKAKRNEHSAAIKIQSLVRGHLARIRQKRKVRRELDSLHQAVVRGEVGLTYYIH